MLQRTILFFYELIRMGFWVYIVNRYYNKPRLRREIKKVYATANLPFDPSYYHRIYYHLLLSSVIVLWFSTLRGKRLSRRERKAAIYLGAATPLYDDLYDEYDFDRHQVNEMIQQEARGDYGIIAKLGIYVYHQLRPLLPRPEIFQQCMDQLALAQEASKKQVGGGLSETTIRKITYDKGGHSFAIYRSILDHAWRPGESEMIYHLGSLIQLTSDLFDLRKDHLNGVQTLVTHTDDINKIRQEYLALIDKTIASAKNLGYQPMDCKRFVMQLRLVTGRGMVCLDQLVRVQKKYGRFDPGIMQRSESVCDMENPLNLLWSFWYSLR